MKFTRRTLVSMLLIVGVAFAGVNLSVGAPQAAAVQDVVGEWDFVYEMQGQETPAKVVFSKMSSGAIGGEWTSNETLSILSEVKFENGKLTFVRTIKLGAQDMVVNFEGTFSGDEIKGKLATDVYGDIPASGVRKGGGAKVPLKILYVGIPGTERTKDFVTFLSKNFAEVKTADLGAFKEEEAKGSDVVILDKDGIEWGGRGDTPPLSALKLSDKYAKATISLGIPGAFLTSAMRLKTGYM